MDRNKIYIKNMAEIVSFKMAVELSKLGLDIKSPNKYDNIGNISAYGEFGTYNAPDIVAVQTTLRNSMKILILPRISSWGSDFSLGKIYHEGDQIMAGKKTFDIYELCIEEGINKVIKYLNAKL